MPLRVNFSRLFLISFSKNAKVSEMGRRWVHGTWIWNLWWQRALFSWEREIHSNLIEVIQSAQLGQGEDHWICASNSKVKFIWLIRCINSSEINIL